jgi:hypothetical protein
MSVRARNTGSRPGSGGTPLISDTAPPLLPKIGRTEDRPFWLIVHMFE